jgi:hypothetical protein
MFRFWKKKITIYARRRPSRRHEPIPFESLPFIDNETLDRFLAEPGNVEQLPVDPGEFTSPEIRRMIVSAHLHDASRNAKVVEPA